ncbi:MAG: hypothetical protein ABFQ65_03985 [Nanoarchaeota archaeon]
MKNILISTIFIIFLTSFLSATIVMNTQNLEDTYNLEDTISLPIKIITTTDIIGKKTSVKLICNGLETEIYTDYKNILSGEDYAIEVPIPLMKELLGRSTATCKIKVSKGEEFELTDEFEISDKISITTKLKQSEFSPGEIIIIEGDAIKENQKPAQGFVEISASIINSSSDIKIIDTVKNGYFYVEIPLEENAKAGEYTMNINVYEKDYADEETNKGFTSEKFKILQIPTSLEIIFEEKEVEPGTNVRAKTILHDQTGEKIGSISIITIKNENDEILEQTEKPTEEYLEYKINYNEPPKEWTIMAISNRLNAQATFNIKEKKDIEIELLNNTLKIKNIGNVIYNNTVLVKIGEENLYLNITLNLDEEQEFKLTAPKGEYQVEIMANGKDTLTQNVLLTGRSIDIKEASQGVVTIISHPIAWFFMIGIFGFIIFMFFKKGYQKSVFGYLKSKKKHKNNVEEHSKKFNSLLNFKKTKEKKLVENYTNKAELSLSIKGTKQDAGIICLNIKNFEEIDTSKIKDSMQKIVNLSEEKKAVIYENQNNIFFLFAPAKTRTFKNETPTLKLAQNIKKILIEHNKIFKQKIEFGISINYGVIIAKLEKSVLKFMSLGTIINSAKKIASASNEEILLNEKIKNKLTTSVKTEKKEINNISVYSIKEIKKLGDNKKFLESFMQRMKEDKKK